MDVDLLLDIYGFLPEKFFISKTLSKTCNKLGTKISFSDYQKSFYKLKITWGGYGWTKNGDYCQEYGPYYVEGDQLKHEFWYTKNDIMEVWQREGGFRVGLLGRLELSGRLGIVEPCGFVNGEKVEWDIWRSFYRNVIEN